MVLPVSYLVLGGFSDEYAFRTGDKSDEGGKVSEETSLLEGGKSTLLWSQCRRGYPLSMLACDPAERIVSQ